MTTIIKKSILVLFLYLISTALILAAPRITYLPAEINIIYYEKELRDFFPEPLYKVKIADKVLFYLPGVRSPSVHSIWLLEHSEIFSGESVLDMGTGSGVQGIFAADKAKKVVSTDIVGAAIVNAELNAKIHNVEHIMDVRLGSLFEPIKANEKFDVILFNIVAPYNKETQGLWKLHEQFFVKAGKHLNTGGRIYYQSSLIDNIPRVQEMIKKNNFRITKMDMIHAARQKRDPFVIRIERLLIE